MSGPNGKSIEAYPPEDGVSPRRALVILLIILAVGATLRLRHIADPPTLDELWSLELSTGRGSVQLQLPVNEMFAAPAMTQLKDAPPLRSVWTSLDRVSHPPLYFLALRVWRVTFGAGDVAARWLSLVASLASILLLYDAVRLLCHSRAVALWSAAFLAVAEPQLDHARMIRGYTLLLMFGVLAWWAVARLRESHSPSAKPNWKSIAYAVTLCLATLAMLLTHYFAVGAALALFLFTLLGLRGKARRQATFAVFAAGCLFLAMWGPMLARHADEFSRPDSTTDFLQRKTLGSERIAETVLDFCTAPLRLFVDLPPRPPKGSWWAGVGCVVLIEEAARRRRAGMLLVTLWLVGTIGFVAALDFVRSTTQLREVRYLLLASPALYVLLAIFGGGSVLALSRKRALLKHAIPALILLACLARDLGPQKPPELDWRPIAAFLDDPSRANQPIVFANAQDWFLGHLVMAYRHASTQPPGRPMVVVSAGVPKRVRSRLAAGGMAWAVCLPEQAANIERVLPGWSVLPVDIPDMPRMVWQLQPPGTF